MRLLFGALVLLELLGLLLTPIARPVAAATAGPQVAPRDAPDARPTEAGRTDDWCGESLSEGESETETETETDDADPLTPWIPGPSTLPQCSRRALTWNWAGEERPGTRELPERPPRRLG